jgi:N-acetylneuraminate synthase/sialic acid synthase
MLRELVIDGVTINDESDCYVIAEIGHNHRGSVATAKELFLAAKQCGAHAVKLQKRDNRSLFTREAYDKPYDHRNSYGATYGQHREYLEFGYDEFFELKRYAGEIGISLFATAFDFASADFLAELDLPAFKVASGDLRTIPLLKYIAAFQKPMVISTGGAAMEDVQRAVDAIMPINQQLAILQCTSGYPCEFEEMNLRVITTFRERFPGNVIGHSAHDNGIAMALVGYVLGARIVEKHFTLNRAWKGTDHAFSLEPPGLRRLVRDLQRARIAMGDGVKRIYESELKPLRKMTKKLVAVRDIPAGRAIGPNDIAMKAPGGDGLPPYELDKVIGRIATAPLLADDAITFDVLNGYVRK